MVVKALKTKDQKESG